MGLTVEITEETSGLPSGVYDAASGLVDALEGCLSGAPDPTADPYAYLRELLESGACAPAGWTYDSSTCTLTYDDAGGELPCTLTVDLCDEAFVTSVGPPTAWIPVMYGGSVPFYCGSDMLEDLWLSVYDTCTCEYSFVAPPDINKAIALCLRFTSTRTVVFGMEPLDQNQSVALINYLPSRIEPNIWIVPYTPLVSPARLAITFQGDPPVIGDSAWVTTLPGLTRTSPFGLPRLIRVGDRRCDDWKRRHVERVLKPFVRSREDEWDIRYDWCHPDGAKSVNQVAHMMFLKLDIMSQSLEAADALRALRVQKMLVTRFRLRGEHWTAKKTDKSKSIEFVERASGAPSWFADLAAIEDLGVMRAWMYEWLCVDEDGTTRTPADVHKYFEMFANGELTALESHGAPNGINMFCFTELAFMLADLELAGSLAPDVEPGFWLDMARAFAIACEMFVFAYHEPAMPGTICSYKVQNNPVWPREPDGTTRSDGVPRRALAESDRDTIRTNWDTSSIATDAERLEALRVRFGELVYHALRAEFDGRSINPLVAIKDMSPIA
ncbi:MAG: hypothetical protein H6832_04720 [Planctomycetes bacterium]|nr:hypothetical protein [Planctomycetota bacterium]MCB9890443.1 hypothetical protein [Planctomycetota bacterium]MCB9917684.1 hypothetical protein [Planctomycetota bacterium]